MQLFHAKLVDSFTSQPHYCHHDTLLSRAIDESNRRGAPAHLLHDASGSARRQSNGAVKYAGFRLDEEKRNAHDHFRAPLRRSSRIGMKAGIV